MLKRLLAASIAFCLANGATLQRRNSCDDLFKHVLRPWHYTTTSGSQSFCPNVNGCGQYLCSTKWPTGGYVTGLKAYCREPQQQGLAPAKTGIYRLDVVYSSGAVESLGTDADKPVPCGVFEIAKGEVISQLDIYPSEHDDSGIAQIGITTKKPDGSQGGVNLGDQAYKGKPDHINVGGGLIVGVAAHQATVLNGLALIFTSSAIKDIVISDFQFDGVTQDGALPKWPVPGKHVLQSAFYRNNLDTPYSLALIATHTVTTDLTYQSASKDEFEGGFKFSAGWTIPYINVTVGAEGGPQWRKSTEITTIDKTTDTFTLTYQGTATVPAHKSVYCQAAIYSGDSGKQGFTVNVFIHFEDGSEDSYREHGTVDADLSSAIISQCDYSDDTTNKRGAAYKTIAAGVKKLDLS